MIEFGELYAEPSKNGITVPKSTRGHGVPMVNMGEIFRQRRIVGPFRELVPASDAEVARFRLERDDLLFARLSLKLEGVGKCCIYADDETAVFESSIIRCRLDSRTVNPSFYFHYFQSRAGRQSVMAIAEQTAAAGIRSSDLRRIRVPCPSITEQAAIASVLDALDDKIELNRGITQTLDETARAIFRSWFVDFGGRDLDDDTCLPTGWSLLPVSQVADVNGWTLGKRDPLDAVEYVEISAVNRGRVDGIATYRRGKEPGRARRRLRHGDTVMSTVRPDRRAYFLALNPSDSMVASTGFAVLTPRAVPWSYLHAAMTQDAVFEQFGRLADGEAYPAISGDQVGSYLIPMPYDAAELDRYHAVAAPLYARAAVARNESVVLSDVRDAILPRLLSRELSIPDAEKAAEEVV